MSNETINDNKSTVEESYNAVNRYNIELQYNEYKKLVIESVAKYIDKCKEMDHMKSNPFFLELHLHDYIISQITSSPDYKICHSTTTKEEYLLKFLESNPFEEIKISYKSLNEILNNKYKLTETDNYGKTINYLMKNNNISNFIEDAVKNCKENIYLSPEEEASRVFNKIVGYRIHCLRKTFNHSGEYLAERISISKSKLSKIENADITISLDDLYNIKLKYSCTLEYLVGLASGINQNRDGLINPIQTIFSNYLLCDYNHWGTQWTLINKIDALVKENNSHKLTQLEEFVDTLLL